MEGGAEMRELRFCSEDFPVARFEPENALLPGVLPRANNPGGSQRPAAFPVNPKLGHRCGNRVSAGGVHQHRGIARYLRQGRLVAADDGDPAHHVFQDRQAEPFVETEVKTQACVRVEGFKMGFVHIAQAMDSGVSAGSEGIRQPLVDFRPSAHDHQLRAVAPALREAIKCLDHRRDVLPPLAGTSHI